MLASTKRSSRGRVVHVRQPQIEHNRMIDKLSCDGRFILLFSARLMQDSHITPLRFSPSRRGVYLYDTEHCCNAHIFRQSTINDQTRRHDDGSTTQGTAFP